MGEPPSKRSRKEKNKDVKRATIDVSHIPEMSSMPGAIDPVGFAKARVQEVLLLKKDIEASQYRGSRRVFQTLPRSMRRRAASYNLKRLPIRLRQKALEEAAKDPATAQKKVKKPPCRRRRRRPQSIVEEFGRRQQGKLWLETHLWHAKRAHMEDHWGYRIAVGSNEKCLKACLRASLDGCFLYDCSYYEVLEYDLSWGVDHLRTVIPAAALTALVQSIDCPHPSQQRCHLLCTTVFEGESDKPLGPVWIIPDAQLLRLIMHPLIAAPLLRALNVPQAGLLRGEYCMFTLEGRRTVSVLENVLQPLPPRLGGLGHARDPRFGATGELPEESPSLWEREAHAEALKGRKSEKELDEMRSKLAIPGTKLSPTSSDPALPYAFLPIDASDPAHPKRWLLLIPRGWGGIVWRSIIQQKARFGGLKESKFVDAEHDRPSFPDDWAASPLFPPFNDQAAVGEEAKWLRTPPAKRVNYQKLGITHPFRLLLSKVPNPDRHTPRRCRIECPERGVPVYNARILHHSQVIGLVTTGHYSQRRGRGVAFATCYFPHDQTPLPIPVQFQNLNGPPRPAHIVEIVPE